MSLLIKTPFCLLDALNWEVTYKDLVNKVVCDPSNCECMTRHCTNCPGNALCNFLEEELSDINPDFQFHYSHWQTTDRASLVLVTSTCEEYKDTYTSNKCHNKTFVFSQMSG